MKKRGVKTADDFKDSKTFQEDLAEMKAENVSPMQKQIEELKQACIAYEVCNEFDSVPSFEEAQEFNPEITEETVDKYSGLHSYEIVNSICRLVRKLKV